MNSESTFHIDLMKLFPECKKVQSVYVYITLDVTVLSLLLS